MMNEEREPTTANTNKKKIAGIILFWVGIATILFCLLYFVTMVDNILEPEAIPVISVSFYGAIAGFLFVLIGTPLYFVGRSQEKKQKTLHEAHDSHSDYNKTIDKP